MNPNRESLFALATLAFLCFSGPTSGQKVYWSDHGTKKIQRANLDGSRVEDVVHSLVTGARGMAVDSTRGKMYWTDTNSGRVLRANLDGTDPLVLLTGLNLPHAIAVDAVHEKIYVGDVLSGFEQAFGRIRQANLDGTGLITIIEDGCYLGGQCVFDLGALAIDPIAGKIYWTISDGFAFEPLPSFAFKRANLDGTSIEYLALGQGMLATGIALDLNAQKMYWIESAPVARIRRANLNGSSLETLVQTGPTSPQALTLDSSAGKMYWTETGRIMRANLNGSGVEVFVSEGLTTPNGITFDESTNQLFWTDFDGGTIQGSGTTNPSPVTILRATLISADALAIDHESPRLYWTDPTGHRIWRARLDGSEIGEIVNLGIGEPKGIAVDPLNVQLYFSDRIADEMLRANLDGTELQPLSPVPLMEPQRMAFDSIAEKVYWTDSGLRQIQRANADGTESEPLSITHLGTVYGVDIDQESETVYWAERATQDGANIGRIRRCNEDGTSIETLYAFPQNVGYPWGIAADPTGEMIYWTHPESKRVLRSALDGSETSELYSAPNNGSPRGIALDTINGKVYWTDSYNDRIQRANLDGTTVEDVLLPRTKWPRSMALDLSQGKIYWADSGLDVICRANTDGSDWERLPTMGVWLSGGIALDSVEQKLYWTDLNLIKKANLDGSNIESFAPEGGAAGIAVDMQERKLYYTQLGNYVAPNDGKISRSNLDGSEAEALISTGLGDPLEIVLAPTIGKMYWTDDTPGHIGRANLDGTDFQILVNASDVHPGIALDMAGGQIYYARGNQLWRAGLSGENAVPLGSAGYHTINGMVIDSAVGKIYRSSVMYDSPYGYFGYIRRNDLDGFAMESVFDQGINQPEDVALDLDEGKIYWLESWPSAIRRADLDGTNIEKLNISFSTSSAPFGLEIAKELGKIYWTLPDGDSGSHGRIRRANLDGSSAENVLPESSDYSPRGIAFHAAAQRVVWGDGTKLVRADANGANRETLVESALSSPLGISIDHADNRVYWTDMGRIFRSSLDGVEMEQIVPSSSTQFAVDLALDLADERIYWTDRGGPWEGYQSGKIRRCGLDGSDLEVVANGLRTPRGIALNSAPNLMFSDPPSCAIDARQPHDLNDVTARFGWSILALQFSSSATLATQADFEMTEVGGDDDPPTIAEIEHGPEATWVTIHLTAPIEPGAWTCIEHLPSGTKSCFGYLPGDVNGDRFTSPVDILALIDNLNGIIQPPYEEHQTDIDRSNAGTPADVLRLIDLLNGANAFEPWNGQTLPPCP